jgi:hypothetical protein
MHNIVWDLDRAFTDTHKNDLRVLQRTLHDLNMAKNSELLPFFQETSLFQLNTLSNKPQNQVMKGYLTDLSDKSDSLELTFSSFDKMDQVTWTINSATRILITIWRVNNILDTLQVNIIGKEETIYMQTGGGSLLDLLFVDMDNIEGSQSIKEAVEIFNQNAMGKINQRFL